MDGAYRVLSFLGVDFAVDYSGVFAPFLTSQMTEQLVILELRVLNDFN